jgi:hypothetical protein
MVRCGTAGYPASPTDGALVCDRATAPGAADSFSHTGLANGVTYYYTVFAHDSSGHYSAGQRLSATPYATGIGYSKGLGDNAVVDVQGKVVTAVFGLDGCIYINEVDNTNGIRVLTTQTGLAVGDRVNISGKMATRTLSGFTSERYISPTTPITRVASGEPLKPVFTSCLSVGGGPAGPLVPGVKNGSGINSIGLLLKIAGRITAKVGQYIWVDDGSTILDYNGKVGVMVKCPDTSIPVNAGDHVSVAGIVEGSIPSGWTTNRRMIHIRDYSDIRKMN